MSIYADMKATGVEMDHHESDLYVPVTDATRAIVAEYEFRTNVTTFYSQIDKKPWYDIPFAYLPYWERLPGVKPEKSDD